MAITGGTNESAGRTELESVVADTDGNVDTIAGYHNVPEKAANKTTTTIAEVEQEEQLEERLIQGPCFPGSLQ